MTIRIAHLYYDIMNLYGEIGNIKVLRYHLEEQGIKVIIDNLSINDEIDFNKYDLLYMGCGTKDSMLNALNDLRRYKDDLKNILKIINMYYLQVIVLIYYLKLYLLI